MKRSLLALLVVLAVAIPTVAGAATAPTISITSPAPGATISKAVSDTILVNGTATFDVPVAATRTFYLRRDACGGSAAQNTRLSTASGTDGGDGCGNLIGGASTATTNYPAENGLPLTVDTTKAAKVTIVVSSFTGLGGVGNQQITATLTGRAGSTTKTLGSGSQSILLTPGTDAYTYEITIPIANPGAPISTLNLALAIGGGFQHGHVNLNSASFVELPILDTGRVDVSSDSSTFAASKTAQAVLNGDGTWTAEIVTPSVGSRKIYARAVQGGLTTNATPVSITVIA
jgi:hypothetical protein